MAFSFFHLVPPGSSPCLVTRVPRFLLLFLSLLGNSTYTSCLDTDHLDFYYINQSKTPSCFTSIPQQTGLCRVSLSFYKEEMQTLLSHVIYQAPPKILFPQSSKPCVLLQELLLWWGDGGCRKLSKSGRGWATTCACLLHILMRRLKQHEVDTTLHASFSLGYRWSRQERQHRFSLPCPKLHLTGQEPNASGFCCLSLRPNTHKQTEWVRRQSQILLFVCLLAFGCLLLLNPVLKLFIKNLVQYSQTIGKAKS